MGEESIGKPKTEVHKKKTWGKRVKQPLPNIYLMGKKRKEEVLLIQQVKGENNKIKNRKGEGWGISNE